MEEPISEVEVLTPTKKRLLEQRALRALTPEKAYAGDNIRSTAEVLAECGGQAAVVFRAVIGSYMISTSKTQCQGFTVHPVFVKATQLGERQFRRGVERLAEAGFIEADNAPGRRPRIRLTAKGKRALSKTRIPVATDA